MRQPAFARDPFVSDDATTRMADEVRASLMAPVPFLPSKYFYDDAGRRLFEQITELPEYYQTRTEWPSSPARADESWPAPAAGAGGDRVGGPAARPACSSTPWPARARCGAACCSTSTSASSRRRMRALSERYPGLEDAAGVGDFQDRRPSALGAGGPRLAVFLGATIGNLEPARSAPPSCAGWPPSSPQGDGFLLGVDLVKDTARLHAPTTTRPA